MKLLCCVKVVADFDLPANHRWEIADNNVDFSFYRKIINCYDAACVELALQTKAAAGQEVSVTALTVSGDDTIRFIKPLYAIGVDRCVQLATDDDLRFVPEAVAQAQAEWLRQNPHDYILLGARNSVGQNGAVGPLLAELLGWALYSGVTAFALSENSTMQLKLRVDEAELSLTAAAPAVLVLDDSVTTLLHTPTIKEKLAVSSRTVERQDAAIGLTPLQMTLQTFAAEKACTMLTLEQAAGLILGGGTECAT